MNKYIKNYVLNVANTVMTLVFPIITFPYVSRILGPAQLGLIGFVQSYGYYFTHIASFGISSYAIREVSRIRCDHQEVERVSNEIFNLNLFFSVVSTVLYFVGVFTVQNFRDNFVVFAIYSVVVLSNFLSLDWLLQSFDDYYFSVVRNLVVRSLSIMAVFLFVRNEGDFSLYMAINCISEMGSKLPTLLYSRKNYARLSIKWRYLNFAAHIRSLFTLFSFRLVNGISANLDKLMIGFMMAYANVGIYSAGVKFVLMLTPIVEAVGVVLFPKINISAGGSKEEYARNLKINYDLILLMGVPMAIGMYLISGRLIPLLAGDQYVGAVVVSRVMSAIIVLGPLGDMLGSKTLLVHKKDRQLLICSAIVAVSNIILNFLFIPFWGVNGAAVASVISYGVAVSARLYFSKKILNFHVFTGSMLKYFLFTVPFILIYLIFRQWIDGSNLWMFCFVAVCGGIYTLELLLTRDYLVRMAVEKILKREMV